MTMIRGKILFFSLLGMGVAATVLGVVQMWTSAIEWDLFVKIMGTIVVMGTVVSTLIAVDYDMAASRKKWLLFLFCALLLGGAGLIVGQIWLQWLKWAVFVKILITLAAAVGLIGFVLAVSEDFGTGKRLRDQNFID